MAGDSVVAKWDIIVDALSDPLQPSIAEDLPPIESVTSRARSMPSTTCNRRTIAFEKHWSRRGWLSSVLKEISAPTSDVRYWVNCSGKARWLKVGPRGGVSMGGPGLKSTYHTARVRRMLEDIVTAKR